MRIAMVVNGDVPYETGMTLMEKAEEYKQKYGSCEVTKVGHLYRFTFPLHNGDMYSIDWAVVEIDEKDNTFARAVSLPEECLTAAERKLRSTWANYLRS